MKILIFLLAGIALTAAQSTPSQKLENTLLDLRQQMPCGFEDLGLPPLAPLHGDYFDLYHKLFIFKIHGALKNFVIDGLNNFDINNVNLNVLTLKMNADLTFNKIRAKGKYIIDSWVIKLLKIRGKGDFDMTLDNLSVKVDARIGMVDGVLRLMEMDVVVGLKNMKSKITGLLIGPLGGLVLNSIVEKTVVKFINNNQRIVTDNIREIMLPQINNFMKDMTVKDMLNMLQNPPFEVTCGVRKAPAA